MNFDDITAYAQSLGADVFIRSENNQSFVCIYTDAWEHEVLGRVWNHVIYVFQSEQKWHIGYAQCGQTRSLTDIELKTLIAKWVECPNNSMLDKLT